MSLLARILSVGWSTIRLAPIGASNVDVVMFEIEVPQRDSSHVYMRT